MASRSTGLQNKREEIRRLWQVNCAHESPLSLNAFAATHHIAKSTLSGWVKDLPTAPERPAEELPEDPEERRKTVSQRLQEEYLQRSRWILDSIRQGDLGDSKSLAEKAQAAERFTKLALALGSLDSPNERSSVIDDEDRKVSEDKLNEILGIGSDT